MDDIFIVEAGMPEQVVVSDYRVDVKDYKAFGEKIAEWSLHPEARPKTLEELRSSVGHLLDVPAKIANLEFVQAALDTLLVKLPAPELVRASLKYFGDDESEYFVPKFYYDKLCEGYGGMSNLDFLYSRLGDYTIAQCM